MSTSAFWKNGFEKQWTFCIQFSHKIYRNRAPDSSDHGELATGYCRWVKATASSSLRIQSLTHKVTWITEICNMGYWFRALTKGAEELEEGYHLKNSRNGSSWSTQMAVFKVESTMLECTRDIGNYSMRAGLLEVHCKILCEQGIQYL